MGSISALVCACGSESPAPGAGGARARGAPVSVEAVRVESVPDYRPPAGKPLTIPPQLAPWRLDGATGQVVAPPEGMTARPALRMTAVDATKLTIPGPLELDKFEALAVVTWLAPKRVLALSVGARAGDDVWFGPTQSPVREGEGWQLFRLPLPTEAVQAKVVDGLAIDLSGSIVGDLALETPVLQWALPKAWRALGAEDDSAVRPIVLDGVSKPGFALLPGRAVRARAKLPVDGGQLVFSHGSIDPVRGTPTRALFAIAVRHPDGRVGTATELLKTRGRWSESVVPFQGKAGEVVEIAIEFVVEGPAWMCTAISSPEVYAP